MWNPASKGYVSLLDKAPYIHNKLFLRVAVGLLILGILVFFHDIPRSLLSRDPIRSCSSTKGLTTEVLGGVPGFLVFQNVWFRNETFYFYNPHTDGLPTQTEVLSAPAKLELSLSTPVSVPDLCFKGSTLWLNENSRAGWSGLWHYYHFAAENIVAGLAALATAGLVGVPDRLLMAWDGNWRDRFGMNEMAVKGIWGESMERVITEDQWARLGEDGHAWAFFEQIAIIDRWATHRHNPVAEQWNKMLLPIFEANPPIHFFEPARKALLDTYHIHAPTSEDRLPKLLYIDRQNTDRRLPNETHDALLDLFGEVRDQGRMEFEHVLLEDWTPHQQIEKVAYADIMVGIHGNGLTHEMWMPSQSTLIELFHPTSFLRDYQSIAAALGHSYYAVRNDTVLTQQEWEAHPGEQNPGMMHNGATVHLHLPFFRTVLDDALERHQ